MSAITTALISKSNVQHRCGLPTWKQLVGNVGIPKCAQQHLALLAGWQTTSTISSEDRFDHSHGSKFLHNVIHLGDFMCISWWNMPVKGLRPAIRSTILNTKTISVLTGKHFSSQSYPRRLCAPSDLAAKWGGNRLLFMNKHFRWLSLDKHPLPHTFSFGRMHWWTPDDLKSFLFAWNRDLQRWFCGLGNITGKYSLYSHNEVCLMRSCCCTEGCGCITIIINDTIKSLDTDWGENVLEQWL